MRIIAGEFRGRNLAAPEGNVTRPTADRTREAVFHIINSGLRPFSNVSKVLDLYAGSGALGFEALSRGAKHVTFVENDSAAIQAIRANAAALKVESRVTVISSPLPAAINQIRGARSFDLIFADPPYALDALQSIRNAAGLASKDALLVFEHSSKDRPSPGRPWRLLERRTWGAATVSFFRLEETPVISP